MPEVKRYVVTQTRVVRVSANSAKDAAQIAAAAFQYGQNSAGGVALGRAPEGIWGNTDSRIEETQLLTEQVR